MCIIEAFKFFYTLFRQFFVSNSDIDALICIVNRTMSYKMNVLDYYSIPEFKEIMDNEVFPEVDRQLQDEEDFEAEFGSEGNFYKRLDQDR